MSSQLSLLCRIASAALASVWLMCAAAQPAELVARVELPGTGGRLDHLAIDLAASRLYVAARGANSIEAIDLHSMTRVFRLPASGEPQGAAFSGPSRRLFVANGEGGNVQVFEADRLASTVDGLPDADNLRLSADGRHLFVGYGKALAAIDVRTLAVKWRAALPDHPEAFEVSPDGSRVYVNVPGAGSIEVVDADDAHRAASWPIAPLAGNFPMAQDSDHGRIFVATRKPAALLMLDADDGRQLQRLDLCGDADDLFFDARRRRVYAICGEGELRVFIASDRGMYALAQRIRTSPGARTGLFVPELDELFVAEPRRAGPAQIMVFRLH